MIKYIKYFWYVVKHKWFVFLECCKYGLVWQGIIHDWHKFLPSEFIPYAKFFHGGVVNQIRDETGYYKPTDTGYKPFDKAWFLHQKRAYHHWQSWCFPDDGGEKIIVMDMPNKYMLEMICDWRGAGRAQGTPDTLAWYHKNRHKMVLSSHTRILLEIEIGYMYSDK
jgi:hypothetical protein